MTITVFTDGACSGNPGPGGWAAILVHPRGHVDELGGGESKTTNNRMEMKAVIAALKAVKDALHPVRVYTDSTYVISGVTSWLTGWKRRGWRTFDGKQVLNRDLWEELDFLVSARAERRASWHYVRGHSGSPGNERCDAIAVSFAQGAPESLYSGPLSAYGCDVLRLPKDIPVPKSSSGRPKTKGGFYLSLLEGKLQRHEAWEECRARVSGKSGARFKKVSSAEEEAEIIRRWGV